MAIARHVWFAGLRRDYSDRKRTIVAQRNERTRDISLAWKNGYAALKAENDRLELERNEEFQDSMVANDRWFQEQLAMGPPTG